MAVIPTPPGTAASETSDVVEVEEVEGGGARGVDITTVTILDLLKNHAPPPLNPTPRPRVTGEIRARFLYQLIN